MNDREIERRNKVRTCSNGSILIFLPVISNIISKGIIRVRLRKKGLNTNQYCSNLQSRAPFIFQDVKANSSQSVNVRMINPC